MSMPKSSKQVPTPGIVPASASKDHPPFPTANSASGMDQELKDWDTYYKDEWFQVESEDELFDFYFAYLLLGAHMLRTSYPGIMADFAAWFVKVVADEGYDARDMQRELEMYYAAAFEFILIGAMLLEGTNMACCA